MMPPRVLASGPKPCGGNYVYNIYAKLNLFIKSLSISYTKKLKATFEQLLDFGATFEQLLEFWPSNF